MSYSGIIWLGVGVGLFDFCQHKELPTTKTLDELVRYIERVYGVKRANIKCNCHDELTFDRIEHHSFRDDFDDTPEDVKTYYKVRVWRTERVGGKELEDALK